MQEAVQQQFLNDNEREINRVRMHPIIFLQPVLMYLASLYLLLQTAENMKLMGWFLLFASTGVLVYSFFRFRELSLILTNQRLLLRTGLFMPRYFGFALDQIAEISTQESWVGRLFNYAQLSVQPVNGRFCQVKPYKNLVSFVGQLKQQQQIYFQTMVADHMNDVSSSPEMSSAIDG